MVWSSLTRLCILSTPDGSPAVHVRFAEPDVDLE
jgi:hypothetical protein